MLAVLALTACGGAKKQAAQQSQLPPGCSVAEVDQVVRDFLLRPSFAPPGTFEVYATSESDGHKLIARKRATALVQARRRVALGEVSRLIALRVGKQDFNHARITFQLTRRAPDYTARRIHNHLVTGAGTIDCAHQLVAAWVTKGP